MKIITTSIIILMLMIVAPSMISAQKCYKNNLDAGKKEYYAGNYEKALSYFSRGCECSECSSGEVDCTEGKKWIDKCKIVLFDETVMDIDGNVYHQVIIGTQIWMVENLKTTHYRDGSLIPKVTDDTEWSDLTKGAYCNYYEDPGDIQTYGRLYNWDAVKNEKGIAPLGWHVPTVEEWITLINFLGDTSISGGKLKETGTTHWKSPNTGATNNSGFFALPGGFKYVNAGEHLRKENGFWWSSSSHSIAYAYAVVLFFDSAKVGFGKHLESSGLSVRLIKD